jgi:hypothetical protein
MIDERRTARASDAETGPSHVLPAKAWREIVQRAGTLGMVAELLADGTEVRLVAILPSDGPAVQAESGEPAPSAGPTDSEG